MTINLCDLEVGKLGLAFHASCIMSVGKQQFRNRKVIVQFFLNISINIFNLELFFPPLGYITYQICQRNPLKILATIISHGKNFGGVFLDVSCHSEFESAIRIVKFPVKHEIS